MDSRTYPDIEFLETDAEIIENNMIALYELMTGRKFILLPRNVFLLHGVPALLYNNGY